MSNVAYLGLDISQADVSACFLLADGGEPVPRWTVSNSQPGAERLSATVTQLCQAHQVTDCASAWKLPACYGGTSPVRLSWRRCCAPSSRTSTCSIRIWCRRSGATTVLCPRPIGRMPS